MKGPDGVLSLVVREETKGHRRSCSYQACIAKVYTATSARRFRQLPRTRLLYSASYGIMTLHHRALSNLVVGGLVLEGRVAGVVLVLLSYGLSAQTVRNIRE